MFLCMTLFINAGYGQNFQDNDLIGQWEIKKVSIETDQDITIDDKKWIESFKQGVFTFKEDKTFQFKSGIEENEVSMALRTFCKNKNWKFNSEKQSITLDCQIEEVSLSIKQSNGKSFLFLGSLTFEVEKKKSKVISYYPDGFVKVEIIPLENGKERVQEYGEYGKTKMTVETKMFNINGKETRLPDGETKYFDEYGKKTKTEKWKEGVKFESTSFHKNGEVKSITSWVGEKGSKYSEKDGPFKEFNENGVLTAEGNHSKDKKIGKWKYYYDTGELYSVDDQFVNGKLNGKEYYYFKNGQTKKVIDYTNGVKNGEHKVYFENGTLSQKGIYKNGKYDDTWYDFYSNGKLHRVGRFKEGTFHGAYKIYYKNGQLKTDYNYVLGKWEGVYTAYYKNGNIRIICEFSNDKLKNVFTRKDINGQDLDVGTIKDGTGTELEYDQDRNGKGILFRKNTYKDYEIIKSEMYLKGMSSYPEVDISKDFIIPIYGETSDVNWVNDNGKQVFKLQCNLEKAIGTGLSVDSENLFVFISNNKGFSLDFNNEPLSGRTELFHVEDYGGYSISMIDKRAYNLAMIANEKKANSIDIILDKSKFTADNFTIVVFKGTQSKFLELMK